MLLLESLELAHEIIELRVADLRLIGDVVELFVLTDQTSELGNA
jgi:hypothetical protein